MFLFIVVTCGSVPPAGSNSVIFSNTGTTYQSTVTYACNTGYETNASTTLLCQASGQWNGTSGPACMGLFIIIICCYLLMCEA